MGKRNGLMVLGWHNVEGSWCFPAAPGQGPRGMELQFRLLRAATNVVPLGWALNALDEGRPLPPRAVAITFDDGYRDNLTLAGPMLRRLRLAATCFLVPGILSGDVDPWWERLPWAMAGAKVDRIEWGAASYSVGSDEDRRRSFKDISKILKTRTHAERELAVDELVSLLGPAGEYRVHDQFLDWDGARALRGHMELGSHTMHHAILARETAEEQADDLAESRRRLRERLDIGAEILAYPNGTSADFGPDTFAAAEQAGYSHAITTERGWTDASTHRYAINRRVMNPERGVRDLVKLLRDLPRN